MAQKPKPRGGGFGGNKPRTSPKVDKVVKRVSKEISQSASASTIRALTDSKLTPAQRVAAVGRAISPFGGRISSSEKEKLKNQFMMYQGTIKSKSSRPIASAVSRAKASSKKK
jgi:tellurite resistance protein